MVHLIIVSPSKIFVAKQAVIVHSLNNYFQSSGGGGLSDWDHVLTCNICLFCESIWVSFFHSILVSSCCGIKLKILQTEYSI